MLPLARTDDPTTLFYTSGTNCYSLPTKLRLAFLHERGEAFLGVLALEYRLQERALGLQPLVEWTLDPAVHRELYGTDGLRRAARELLRVLSRLLFQAVRREQPIE